MIYTELTNKAMKLACEAHKGQSDRGGIPYIFHPYHLAEQMDNETRVCIALLHDVVEDTDITIEQLRAEFPPEVTDALELLTHDENVDYYDYVKGICDNYDASMVKLADLIHNMTESRLEGMDIGIEKQDRWFQKYMKALHMVTDSIEKKIKNDHISDYEYYKLISQYEKRSRQTIINADKDAKEYLTDEQYETLTKLTLEEQMKCFRIEYVESRQGSLNDYSKKKYFNLEEFMDGYRSLILAEGCIVGIMDVNTDGTYCRKRVQPVWINGDERYIKDFRFIDHSWDHMAAASETETMRLVWKDNGE